MKRGGIIIVNWRKLVRHPRPSRGPGQARDGTRRPFLETMTADGHIWETGRHHRPRSRLWGVDMPASFHISQMSLVHDYSLIGAVLLAADTLHNGGLATSNGLCTAQPHSDALPTFLAL
jgi:hypothetical protein